MQGRTGEDSLALLQAGSAARDVKETKLLFFYFCCIGVRNTLLQQDGIPKRKQCVGTGSVPPSLYGDPSDLNLGTGRIYWLYGLLGVLLHCGIWIFFRRKT